MKRSIILSLVALMSLPMLAEARKGSDLLADKMRQLREKGVSEARRREMTDVLAYAEVKSEGPTKEGILRGWSRLASDLSNREVTNLESQSVRVGERYLADQGTCMREFGRTELGDKAMEDKMALMIKRVSRNIMGVEPWLKAYEESPTAENLEVLLLVLAIPKLATTVIRSQDRENLDIDAINEIINQTAQGRNGERIAADFTRVRNHFNGKRYTMRQAIECKL